MPVPYPPIFRQPADRSGIGMGNNRKVANIIHMSREIKIPLLALSEGELAEWAEPASNGWPMWAIIEKFLIVLICIPKGYCKICFFQMLAKQPPSWHAVT